MNTFALVAAAAAAVLLSLFPGGIPGAAIVVPGLIGGYMGCYFWLVSDEGIVVRR